MAKQGKFSPRGLKAIKKIAQYQTTDGSRWESFKDANRHQSMLDLKQRINAFVDSEMADHSEEAQLAIVEGIMAWEQDRRFNMGASTTRRKVA